QLLQVGQHGIPVHLEQLEATGAETALWDALLVGAEALAGSDDGRASIVVLSDGDDTISDAEPGEVIDRFDSGSVALYAVAIESSDTDLVALEQVAAGIGGQFLATSDIGQLDSLYTDIAGRLANRYRVWFAPVGSGERTVVVSVATDRGVASARTLVGTGTSVAGPAISEPTTGDEPAPILNLDEEQTLGLVVAPSAGGLSSPGLLWVGLGSMFAAMLVGGALLVRPGNQVRLDAAASADRITGLNLRAGRVIDRVLASHDRGKRIDRRLEAADVNLRPGEFVLAMFVIVVAVAVLVGVLAGAAQAAIVVAVIVIGASILLGVRARKRQNRFADQLTETLGIMASSLRAGQSLPKAIELVGAEAPSPTAEQFHRIAFEVRVGRDLTDSIRDTAERMASPDLEWVAQAIDINREYGGDLTEILDNVAGTIRERRTVARQVDALSAESRATGWLLMALPVVIFLFSWWRTPDTIAGFVGDPIGRILLVGAITGMAVGHLWIRQLVKVKY
ncbi:MAG: type II secretion system F family protein, partial [Actinomycetota bacterium]